MLCHCDTYIDQPRNNYYLFYKKMKAALQENNANVHRKTVVQKWILIQITADYIELLFNYFEIIMEHVESIWINFGSMYSCIEVVKNEYGLTSNFLRLESAESRQTVDNLLDLKMNITNESRDLFLNLIIYNLWKS